MTLIDTNAVSEAMRTVPHSRVPAWLNRRAADSMWVPAITVAEIACGLRRIPGGRRETELRERFERFLASGCDRRMLDCDRNAALTYGEIMETKRQMGRSVSVADGPIARSRHLDLATRNVADCIDCGIRLANPWTEAS